MKILLINPPHPAIGSRIPREHLPPLGLLSIGGPLLDAGHQVKLLDAEFGPMRLHKILCDVREYGPEAVLIGHSGSTSGHPSAMNIARGIRSILPRVWIVYGGVFPTYHWPEIMANELGVDFIIRGEGEESIVQLMSALERNAPFKSIPGLVYRTSALRCAQTPETGVELQVNPPAPPIRDLDALRVGWELIDHRRYTYYGHRRAVVVQFSRGCPHHCNYCGQHGFWRSWRHRDPVRFARELARLHREQGVDLINFADENPTADREAWKEFLLALIAENVPLVLIGTTRAGDIVRDRDILHLYRQAGVARFLLGLESTNDATLAAIRKGSTQAVDREAIRLLRQHGIISMAAWVAGFAQETDADYWRTLRQLIAYDPDQIQALYATPHRWTPFAMQQKDVSFNRGSAVGIINTRFSRAHTCLNGESFYGLSLSRPPANFVPGLCGGSFCIRTGCSAPVCAGIQTSVAGFGFMKFCSGCSSTIAALVGRRWPNSSNSVVGQNVRLKRRTL